MFSNFLSAQVNPVVDEIFKQIEMATIKEDDQKLSALVRQLMNEDSNEILFFIKEKYIFKSNHEFHRKIVDLCCILGKSSNNIVIRQKAVEALLNFDYPKFNHLYVHLIHDCLIESFNFYDYSESAKAVIIDLITNYGHRNELIYIAGICELTELIPVLTIIAEGKYSQNSNSIGMSSLEFIAQAALAKMGVLKYSFIVDNKIESYYDSYKKVDKLFQFYGYISDSISLARLKNCLFDEKCLDSEKYLKLTSECFTYVPKFTLPVLTEMLENFPIDRRKVICSSIAATYTMEDVETARAWFRSNPEIIFKKH